MHFDKNLSKKSIFLQWIVCYVSTMDADNALKCVIGEAPINVYFDFTSTSHDK